MCNLYSITTNQAAIAALFRVVNRYVGNLAPMPGVFPDYPAPVVRNTDSGREMVMMLALASFRVQKSLYLRYGIFMAKRVSGNELAWLIIEALSEGQDPNPFLRISLAVVPDKKLGWRTVIESHSRRYVDRKLAQKMAEVEQKLRRLYALAN